MVENCNRNYFLCPLKALVNMGSWRRNFFCSGYHVVGHLFEKVGLVYRENNNVYFLLATHLHLHLLYIFP